MGLIEELKEIQVEAEALEKRSKELILRAAELERRVKTINQTASLIQETCGGKSSREDV